MIIIAGPCQLESFEHANMIAEHCRDVCSKYDVEYYFKASFDKANRSHIDSKRGLGYTNGIKALKKIKKESEVKVLTDFHEPGQINWRVRKHIDVVQIPAFLCRQTDLLLTAKDSGCIINVKKGQFLAPWDVAGILSKTGKENVWITERGASFGYNQLVVDFTGIQYMRDTYGVPVIFDATHSVQQPGGLGKSSGGNRAYVPGLIRAVCAQGIDGVFLEVHDDPDNAPSDGPNAVWLRNFDNIIESIMEYDYESRKSVGAN